MQWAFNPFEQVSDVIQVVAGPQLSEVARNHPEGPGFPRLDAAHQSTSNHIVDDLSEGSAGTTRFRPQLGSNVVIQRQCRTHEMMLMCRHHDVNTVLEPQRFPAENEEGIPQLLIFRGAQRNVEP
jgi:hypothetical protein